MTNELIEEDANEECEEAEEGNEISWW